MLCHRWPNPAPRPKLLHENPFPHLVQPIYSFFKPLYSHKVSQTLDNETPPNLCTRQRLSAPWTRFQRHKVPPTQNRWTLPPLVKETSSRPARWLGILPTQKTHRWACCSSAPFLESWLSVTFLNSYFLSFNKRRKRTKTMAHLHNFTCVVPDTPDLPVSGKGLPAHKPLFVTSTCRLKPRSRPLFNTPHPPTLFLLLSLFVRFYCQNGTNDRPRQKTQDAPRPRWDRGRHASEVVPDGTQIFHAFDQAIASVTIDDPAALQRVDTEVDDVDDPDERQWRKR